MMVILLMWKKNYSDNKKNKIIEGLDQISTDAFAFHAGTRMDGGKIITSGGRVLNIIGTGPDLKSAIDKAYVEVKKVSFDHMFYRKDIGKKGIR